MNVHVGFYEIKIAKIQKSERDARVLTTNDGYYRIEGPPSFWFYSFGEASTSLGSDPKSAFMHVNHSASECQNTLIKHHIDILIALEMSSAI